MSAIIPAPPCLLSIPLEIRLQIYSLLLTDPNLIIRSLFIRSNYRNTFMSPIPPQLFTSILLVCKQITGEALPILYSSPRFHCPCRVEQLSTQIGSSNFSLIRKMSVDPDDLVELLSSLNGEDRTGKLSRNLDILETEGYRSVALSPSCSRSDLLDALKLCKIAQEILGLHPNLNVIGQDLVVWNGGSDAVDESYARVKWRFVRSEAMFRSDESVLNLQSVLEVLENSIHQRETEGTPWQSWPRTGTYVQYPYLAA